MARDIFRNPDALLRFRAGLGRWFNADGRWQLLQEKENTYEHDPYPCQVVVGPERSYGVVERHGATYNDMLNVIDGIRDEGYTLREPKYPELQVHFRNGEPITSATLLSDFLVERDEESAPVSSFEAMLAAFS